jgi:hypothetical protein
LEQIAGCIHQHALTAPLHGQLYADICAELHSSEQQRLATSGGGGAGHRLAFRRALLNACQRFFEKPPALPENFDQLSDEEKIKEETKIKKHKLGNIHLIAELFKRGLLSETLVLVVVQRLLWGHPFNRDHRPSETEVEMACELLDSVDPQLTRERAVSQIYRHLAHLRETSGPRMKFRVQDTLDRHDHRLGTRPAGGCAITA